MKKCPECKGKLYPDLISGMVSIDEDSQVLSEEHILACDDCDYYESLY